MSSQSETQPVVTWKTHKYQDRIPIWKDLPFTRRQQLKSIVLVFLLLGALALVLFPIFWMFSTALRPRSDMMTRSLSLFPSTITLDHYRAVLFERDWPDYFFNSLVIAFGSVFVSMVFSTLGGYGLSRIEMKYKRAYARGILIGYMFPSILLAIPMFIFWRELGLVNSLFGTIIAISAKTIPIGLWFMWKFFQSVPYHLEESAMMAGATRFRAFYEIALPRAIPGVIAVSILSFAIAWDEFTITKILLPSQENWVVAVAVGTLSQFNQVLWGEMMAVMTLALIPGFIILFGLQKYLLIGFRY